ncbi:MAG: NIPSNAP family protein [Gammaproteobacteria bacterium]|mgnify:CR=1 FL=1|jgi:heme-degrading monooxygenase HmoA|nr:NIPSNAP family protein [Gammaproteobacteria bacterium]
MGYKYRFVYSLILMATPLWANAEEPTAMPLNEEAGLLYELRTYTAHAGKLDALEQRFRNHTMALFEKHGIINVSYWKPLEQPNTLIYLVAHPSQFAAANAWQAFGNDPEWQAVYAASIADGRLVETIQRTFMRLTDYSPQPSP